MSELRALWDYVAGSASSADSTAAADTLASETPAQVSVENPEIDPLDIEQNYQVDAETEEVLAKIARGEMTAEEAMGEGATDAATDVATDAATDVATDAAADVATDVAVDTAGEAAGEGLLAGAAPVAVPVAVGAAVFLIGEDSAVSDDEEKAMLAKSRGQQAAREAAAKDSSGTATPDSGTESKDSGQGPGDYEAPQGDSAPA